MKTALVTGAAKGLGFEWCRQLAKNGYRVILTARKKEEAEASAELLRKEGFDAYGYSLEVTAEEQIMQLAAEMESRFGKLDVLINNAGLNSGTRAKGNKELQQKNLSLTALDASEVLNMTAVNAVAPVIMAKHFCRLLQKSGEGKIISIGSWLGSVTLKKSGGNYSYAMSKSALIMMNKALAYDLAPFSICTVVVNPGWVQTEMGGSSATFTPQQSVNNLIEHVLKKINLSDSGKFLNYDGTEHPL